MWTRWIVSRKSGSPGTEGPAGWFDRLDSGPVAVDTVAWIYWIEDHSRFAPVLAPLFEAADAGVARLVTSALTLLEVLVVPLRAGNLELAARYETLLTRSRGIEVVAIDNPVLRYAASLRARYSIRTPDALQLAAALARRCGAFLTNDRRLPDIPGLRVLRIDDLA